MDMNLFFLVVFLTMVAAWVFGLLGMRIGERRGRATGGFALGFFLGPIGCLIALFLRRPAIP